MLRLIPGTIAQCPYMEKICKKYQSNGKIASPIAPRSLAFCPAPAERRDRGSLYSRLREGNFLPRMRNVRG